MKRWLSWGLLILGLYLVNTQQAAPVRAKVDRPVVTTADLRAVWRPALGADGPAVADRLIKEYTPDCIRATSEAALLKQTEALRAQVIDQLGLELDRRVLSAQLQRQNKLDGYRIDVLRLETSSGLYMPVNLYLPAEAITRQTPFVVLIPGCGWGAHTAEMQKMGGNLAKLGMIVLIAEGFCKNGARAKVEPSETVVYASALVGLPGPFDRFLQELISVITWAVESYPQIDPDRIGVAGYSYGGQIASYLAAVDLRIRAVSTPATYIGDPCDDFQLNSDIWIEAKSPQFLWSTPPRLPILPISWRVALLYPRHLHVTVGTKDEGANPSFLDAVMAYAGELYELGDYSDRLLYRVDRLPHGYQQNRREDTYAWLVHSLADQPLVTHPEQPVTMLKASTLAVDLTGTLTTADILAEWYALNHAARTATSQSPLTPAVSQPILELAERAGPSSLQQRLIWQRQVAHIEVSAFRVDAPIYAFPAFVFENKNRASGDTVLFLPARGTFQELETILQLLADHRTVVSLDYLGIGELKSNRIMRHTFARYFMYNTPNVPQLNIQIIRSYLQAYQPQLVDVYANSWATSFYALLAQRLTPAQIRSAEAHLVPANELLYLKMGQRTPNLLLWGGIFGETSVRELAGAAPGAHLFDRVKAAAVRACLSASPWMPSETRLWCLRPHL